MIVCFDSNDSQCVYTVNNVLILYFPLEQTINPGVIPFFPLSQAINYVAILLQFSC